MRILLPIDESLCSEKTVQWAAHTFDKASTEYHILMVVSASSGHISSVTKSLEPAPDPEALEGKSSVAIATVKKTKAALENLGCHVEKAECITGNIVDEICKYAEGWNIDQVVVGSHGKTALQKLIMGSVSSDILKHCKKPVLIHRNLQPDHELAFN